MRKSVILAALMAVAMSANAQWFDFSNNVGRFDVGANLGVVGIGCDYSNFGVGGVICVYGVYVDFLSVSPEHKYDNHVTPNMYNDTAALSINIGYQIPVLPWLRIMPLVGHCHTSAGLTDATTVNIEVNDNSATMYHDFNVTSRRHYLNYGCGLIIQPIQWVNVYAVYTRHAIYGGISVSLGSLWEE